MKIRISSIGSRYSLEISGTLLYIILVCLFCLILVVMEVRAEVRDSGAGTGAYGSEIMKDVKPKPISPINSLPEDFYEQMVKEWKANPKKFDDKKMRLWVDEKGRFMARVISEDTPGHMQNQPDPKYDIKIEQIPKSWTIWLNHLLYGPKFSEKRSIKVKKYPKYLKDEKMYQVIMDDGREIMIPRENILYIIQNRITDD